MVRPVMVDDTCYFIPCQSQEEAGLLFELLASAAAKEFLNSLIFPDSKRPITADVLRRLSFVELAGSSACSTNSSSWFTPIQRPKRERPRCRFSWSRHTFIEQRRRSQRAPVPTRERERGQPLESGLSVSGFVGFSPLIKLGTKALPGSLCNRAAIHAAATASFPGATAPPWPAWRGRFWVVGTVGPRSNPGVRPSRG